MWMKVRWWSSVGDTDGVLLDDVNVEIYLKIDG